VIFAQLLIVLVDVIIESTARLSVRRTVEWRGYGDKFRLQQSLGQSSLVCASGLHTLPKPRPSPLQTGRADFPHRLSRGLLVLKLSQVEPSSPVWLWYSASLFCHRFYSSPRCCHQSAQCPSESACLTPGPLRSFRPFFTTMGPSDSRALAVQSVIAFQTLQLYPSLGRVSQVPGCSFRARCPTIPRKVQLEFSVIFPIPGVGSFPSRILATFIFSFRGFHTPVHFRCGSLLYWPEASD
jgi:hypothetical protein